MGEVLEESRHLMVAPACLRPKVLALIDREIERARAGEPAYLGFKLNGLTDKIIIDKLIEASQAGVKTDLVVRGICCLVGGVSGLTENIRVMSIVGRYLEHARIYIFGVKERRQIYISSADFMTRNTTRRVEVAVPVYNAALRAHLEQMFADELRDTAKGRVQQPDGGYVRAEGEPFNSQEYFCAQAYSSAWMMSGIQKGKKSTFSPVPAQAAPVGEGRAVSTGKTVSAEKRRTAPTIKIQTRRSGLLNRIFGRE